ncbi:MAG: universal stress protein [Pseudomonadota bacterium]
MFETLLLAVDVNDPAGAARPTQAALRMAAHEKAKIHLLNVVPDDGMAMVSASFAPDHASTVAGEAQSALEAWAKTNIPADMDAELHVTRGKVYHQILKVAKDLDVAAIVVGAHSPDLSDYLLGSNAARVARHATQSVFVIR